MLHFPLIDILRATAALMVVCCHVIAHGNWTSFPNTGLASIARSGWVGVDLFLVISGFVIGKTAIESARSTANWRTKFIDRRLRRIVPLHVATVFIFLLFINPELLVQGWGAAFHLGTHLLFVHNLVPATFGSINGVNWSVALEMQFYLLVAWCTPWLVRAHWLKVILIWSGLAIGWRYLSTIFISSETLDVQTRIFTSYLLIGSLDQFAMGIGVAKLCLDGKLSFTPARGFFWGTSTFILLFASASILNTHPSYWNFDVMVWGWRSLASAGFAALIATVIMIPYSGNWLMRPFCYLGKISYGIYLWHLPVLFSLIAHTPWRGASLLRATLICTIVLAVLSWHGFEKKWMQSKTAKSAV